MSVYNRFVSQSRKPSGHYAKWIGRLMNFEHARLRDWGLRRVALLPGFQVLDVGCGGGQSVKVMASGITAGKVCGIDHSPQMIQLAGKVNRRYIAMGRAEILLASVSDLPFPDEHFDLITAFESYYFFPDLTGDLKEIARTLKTGGRLLLVNEAYRNPRFEKRNTYWTRVAEMMLHSPQEYREFLAEAGYADISIETHPRRNWISAVAVKPQTTEDISDEK